MIYLLRMPRFFITVFLLFFCVFASGEAWGFGEMGGACGSDCASCHQVSVEEAREIIKEVNPEIEVLDIGQGPVRGLWEMTIMARGRKDLAYMDYSKSHIIVGVVLEVKTRKNLTSDRLYDINKVDLSEVSLEEAIVMGNDDAVLRVVVFDDPD
jgi:thiol:disulfide interchange protein DsbC